MQSRSSLSREVAHGTRPGARRRRRDQVHASTEGLDGDRWRYLDKGREALPDSPTKERIMSESTPVDHVAATLTTTFARRATMFPRRLIGPATRSETPLRRRRMAPKAWVIRGRTRSKR